MGWTPLKVTCSYGADLFWQDQLSFRLGMISVKKTLAAGMIATVNVQIQTYRP
jgi:hypothetical protein